MKLKRTLLTVAAIALAAVLVPVSVFAAGGYSVVKSGQYYIVDTIKAETTIDGVLIQTIERRFVPEGRYNPNNPNVPYSSGNGYWDNNGNYINNGNSSNGKAPINRAQTLRSAGVSSLNALNGYSETYGWTHTSRETYSDDSNFKQYVYFRLDNTKKYDYVDIEFTQQVTYDKNWNAIVRYYKNGGDGTAYTEGDLKAMFRGSY